MEYKCPVCGQSFQDELKMMMEHAEEHIVDIIKENNPGWISDDGVCHKCLDYYRKQMKGEN